MKKYVKFIILGLIIIIVIVVSIIIGYNRNKKPKEEDITTENVATDTNSTYHTEHNNTEDTTDDIETTEQITDANTTEFKIIDDSDISDTPDYTQKSTETTTATNTEATQIDNTPLNEKVKDIKFNATGDALYETEKDNINLYKDGISTILVDGHKLTLPCSYQDIVNTFGEPYKSYKDGMYIEYVKDTLDYYTNITQESFNVDVKSGKGSIRFIFTSNEPTDIKNCKCTGFMLSALEYSDVKLFDFSLNNNIHFGSSLNDILTTYPTLANSVTENKNLGEFNIFYDNNDYSVSMYGINNGLYSVSIDLKGGE